MSQPSNLPDFPLVDIPPSAGGSLDAVVRFLVEELVRLGKLQAEHADRVVHQIITRELQGTTGIGRGFAIPHSKSDAIEELIGVVGLSAEAVAWPGAVDSVPVRLVCLLVAPVSGTLRALEAIARKLRGDSG